MSDTDSATEALQWIVDILRRRNIPFQITGGLAARVYGSDRPLNDIDIDVPEERIHEIVPDVRGTIEFGPARYKDERWDLLLLMLNYKGQLIDIGGAYETRICDRSTAKWTSFSCDLSKASNQQLFGIEVSVVDPRDLIAYKQMLIGQHQEEDIAAVEEYLRSSLAEKNPR